MKLAPGPNEVGVPAPSDSLRVKVTFEIDIWVEDVMADVRHQDWSDVDGFKPTKLGSAKEVIKALTNLSQIDDDDEYRGVLSYLWDHDYFSIEPKTLNVTFKKNHRGNG